MKKLFILFAMLVSMRSGAQVTKVTIQASGLTCSMCSNAINKALKSVDYVDKVLANIKNSSFDISFKPGANVSFDELKKKVEDAGFFVAKFNATMSLDNVRVEDDAHVNIHGVTFHFLHVKEKLLTGEYSIQVLDRGYVSAKEFKKNAVFTKMDCYKTGVAGTCCSKSGISAGVRVYHVTI
jgi:copper chaperone CopZ